LFCVFLTCSWVTADLAAGIFHIYAGNRLCADDGSVFVVEVRSHLLDPYQQHQRGIERFPQIREMMVALESEVQKYDGWDKISCVQVDGKNADADFEDVQRAIGPFYNLVSGAKDVRGKHETIMLLTVVATAEYFCFHTAIVPLLVLIGDLNLGRGNVLFYTFMGVVSRPIIGSDNSCDLVSWFFS